MARLPNNARLWKERAEIDYIGPFVKAWAAFNAWFRKESGSRRDRDGLEYVKAHANPVRSEIIPLLAALENGPDGRARPDGEDAQELKLLVAELHNRGWLCRDRAVGSPAARTRCLPRVRVARLTAKHR